MVLKISYSILQKLAKYVVIKKNNFTGKTIIGVKNVEIIHNKF